MSNQMKLGLGSLLSTFGALGLILSVSMNWTAAPEPWGFVLGFVFGLTAGLGAVLAIAGLVGRKRGG